MVHHYEYFILGWWVHLFNLLEVGSPLVRGVWLPSRMPL
jgi:hypothetical protein